MIELPKRAKNITGKVFGWLTALYPVRILPKKQGVVWRLKCKCGNEVEYRQSTLSRGKAKCCGNCNYRREISKYKDLTGRRFGHLTALYVISSAQCKIRRKVWRCKCDCGNECDVPAEYLTRGWRKTCKKCNLNCKWKTETERLLADRWHRIEQRCYNPHDKNYPRWGGRGIKMCDEWLHDKRAFIDWGIKTGFRPELEIDRIDNNKGYSPDNCRWVTDSDQANNRTNNRFITVENEEKSCGRWDKYLGLLPGYTWSYMNRNGKEATSEMIYERMNGIYDPSNKHSCSC